MNRFSFAKFAQLRKRFALLALLGAVSCTANVGAADILVTTVADSGTGSLREAISTAVDGDRIVFEIPGTPTIVLLSDLPAINDDITFANNNAIDVTIDRNGNGPLNVTTGLFDPSVLVINTSGAPSPDADIVAATDTTIFGNGSVTGNLTLPGTIAPGANSAGGTIGTLDVTGNLDISTGRAEMDLAATGGPIASDLINVAGTTTVTGATLAPNFVGEDFEIGQQFLLFDSTNPIVGTFANQSEIFALPNNPFLEAALDGTLAPGEIGLLIADNGNPFTTVADGCNQISAATLLDQLQASGSPPASVVALRNGSISEASLAIHQLSGSIYPSLIGAEINHIQNNLESVRDFTHLHAGTNTNRQGLTPWARGYGVSAEVDRDACGTLGYRQEAGGIELGCGLSGNNGLIAHAFAHLADGNLNSKGAGHKADIESYRGGGSIEYFGQNIYLFASGGAGIQEYDVRRSLSGFAGSTSAESSFDGSAQFGYVELAYARSWAPYVAVHATRVELDAISETGDPDFALMNDGGEGKSLRSVLGLAFNNSAPSPLGAATTRLRFGWLHEYLDESETFVSQVGGTARTLTDHGVTAGKDWAFVRTQVELGSLLGGQFMVAYEGQFNSDSAFNSLLAGTGWVY